MRIPTKLDRYPAKMVSHLADRLVAEYAIDAKRLLDPFCGSGAILAAAARYGIPSIGIDVNPLSDLYCSVKLNGFDPFAGSELLHSWFRRSKRYKQGLPIKWEMKGYWFTPGTLRALECLRAGAIDVSLTSSREGKALLHCFSLAIRLCSRADQRSPKPFISKQAANSRSGKYFDPYEVVMDLFSELAARYSPRSDATTSFICADIRSNPQGKIGGAKFSHVITSPPYINAQDYFRNFKLELYAVCDILCHEIDDIRERFIGTERGNLLAGIPESAILSYDALVPEIAPLRSRDPRSVSIVRRYLHDMSLALNSITQLLELNGTFVLVCGDNLISGKRIKTWKILHRLLKARGYSLSRRFFDKIEDRLLPPKRSGHRGLIKEEAVSVYKLGRH